MVASRRAAFVVTLIVLLATGGRAFADETAHGPRHGHASIVVTAGAGARGGEPESGATSFAVSGGVDVRIHHERGHGGALRFEYVTPLNACDNYVTYYTVDAAYAFRAVMLQGRSVSLVAQGLAGLTLVFGEHRTSSERCAGASGLLPVPLLAGANDHVAIGGVIGGSMDLRFGHYLVGFGGDVRYAPVVDRSPNEADRTFLLRLRFGMEFNL